MQALINKSLTFHNPEAMEKPLTLHKQAGTQEVPSWVRGTLTFSYAVKDGAFIELGRPVKDGAMLPPTAAELISRGKDPVTAARMAEEEQVKFQNGEWPYPERIAAAITVDSLMAAGMSEERAKARVAARAAAPAVSVSQKPKMTAETLIASGLTHDEAMEELDREGFDANGLAKSSAAPLPEGAINAFTTHATLPDGFVLQPPAADLGLTGETGGVPSDSANAAEATSGKGKGKSKQ